MTVLVTRPSPAGEALVQLLQTHQIPAMHTPLITFAAGRELEQFPQKLQSLHAGDLVFAVSQNAVQFAQQALTEQHQHWPEHLHYFAIGRATALSLENVTKCHVGYPKDREISEHLLQLEQLSHITGKKALILRANSGRELLAEQLTQRGVHVEFCECYQRQYIDYSPDTLFTGWQSAQIHTIVITSAEMLQRIFTLAKPEHQSWLLSRQLIVVSERIADLAQQQGWTRIKIASNADNQSLLSALT